MTQGEVGHLVAQLCITLLIVAASIIPIFAGLSALAKWKAAETERVDWDVREAKLRVMLHEHAEERRRFTENDLVGDTDGLIALQARQTEKLKEAGYPVKTFSDFDVEIIMGERPRHAFQAPSEVAWAIVALGCAAIAGVWDVWLG